jgi:hypothetical protein
MGSLLVVHNIGLTRSNPHLFRRATQSHEPAARTPDSRKGAQLALMLHNRTESKRHDKPSFAAKVYGSLRRLRLDSDQRQANF